MAIERHRHDIGNRAWEKTGTTADCAIPSVSMNTHIFSTEAVISVVSNQGTIHYLYKDKQYDFHKAFALFKEFAAKATKNLTVKEHYDIALFFLKQ